MNALEKYAAKAKILAKLKDALESTKRYGGTVRGKNVEKAREALEATKKRGHPKSFQAAYESRLVKKEMRATSKARKQVGGGLAGLAALGIGAKMVAKGAKPKGAQSAAKRLSSFAKKNKRSLAIGGGAAGGAVALGAILKNKRK